VPVVAAILAIVPTTPLFIHRAASRSSSALSTAVVGGTINNEIKMCSIQEICHGLFIHQVDIFNINELEVKWKIAPGKLLSSLPNWPLPPVTSMFLLK